MNTNKYVLPPLPKTNDKILELLVELEAAIKKEVAKQEKQQKKDHLKVIK